MGEKQNRYSTLLKSVDSLIVPDIPASGNLCNVLALVKAEMNLFWAGLYMRQGMSLGLGPFQGLAACTKISWGKGVCGTAAAKGETVIVADVREFPGYIACHEETRSEMVVPGYFEGQVFFVLDVDSEALDFFGHEEKVFFEALVKRFERILFAGKES